MGRYEAGGGITREFAELFARLSDAYPSATVTPQQSLIYARALGDLSIVQLRQACSAAVRECKFFPSVAELRAFVVAPVEDAALAAWSGFQRAAESVGAYGSLEVEDQCAAVALVVVFGSWAEYCATETIGVAAKKAEFLSAYRNARRSGNNGLKLVGLCEPTTGATGRLLASGSVVLAEAVQRQIGGRDAGEA